MAARRPGYHGRNPCSSVRSARQGPGRVRDAMPYASVSAPASATEVHPGDTTDGLAFGSPASLRGAVTPRCAGSQTEVGHVPDRECVVVRQTDPWPDSVDTRRLAQTAPTDRPAHNSPRTYLETSEPILGAGRASDFFSERLREHVLVEGEIGHEPFEPGVLFFHLPQST